MRTETGRQAPASAPRRRKRRELDQRPRVHNRQPACDRAGNSPHLLATLMPQSYAPFYRGKRVLVTGHTGFTGGWLVAWLKLLGAKVCGYGLPPSSRPNFFDATLLDRGISSIFADLRDRETLANAFAESQPEVIFHTARARHSSSDPVEVFSINAIGTINLLE